MQVDGLLSEPHQREFWEGDTQKQQTEPFRCNVPRPFPVRHFHAVLSARLPRRGHVAP